jgi:hypothetical protein
MLAGAPFPGTIMNIHDDFFAKLFWDQSNGYAVTWSGRRFDPKNWYAAVLRPQFDMRGTNASYMVNIAIRQKYLAVIIDNGGLHEDLMPVLLQYYRLADHYENYKFYVPK